jgi:nucleotide-binding universal stress UspA family protein
MNTMSPPPFWNRVLVPTDFSERSLVGLRAAGKWHKLTEVDVILLHVIEPARGGLRIQTSGVQPRMDQEALDCIHRVSSRHFPFAKNITHVVVMGKAANAICKAATDYEVDAILIATHGITGDEKALLGSVTEKVVRQAKCSVLVVREEGPAVTKSTL